MRIFKRLSVSLFAPREIINYRKDKWYVTTFYFLLLLLILIVPTIIITAKKDIISYDLQRQIRKLFTGEEIPFVINNYQLSHVDNDELFVYKKDVVQGATLIITSDIDNIETSSKMVYIVFADDCVYLKISSIQYELFLYSDYQEFKNIDFAQAAQYNNTIFWNNIFGIFERKLNEYRPLITIATTIVAIGQNAMNLITLSLFITLIQFVSLSKVVRFSELWKLSIYLMGAYAIGSVLSNSFSNILLYYIGFFITVTYIFIVGRKLLQDSMGRERNEL